MDTTRPIVITPYYKEDPALLRRCMDSVRAQTVPTEHFLVADGYPQDWIDAEPVRHLKLDRSHRDYGNTPRGVAALLATSEGETSSGEPGIDELHVVYTRFVNSVSQTPTAVQVSPVKID